MLGSFLKKRPQVRVILIAGAWALLVLVFFKTSYGRKINFEIARRLEFQVRDLLGNSPELDPRIKIYAFDDKTMRASRSQDYHFSYWLVILEKLVERQPHSVQFTKMFFYPVGMELWSKVSEEDFAKATAKRLERFSLPIYSAVFTKLADDFQGTIPTVGEAELNFKLSQDADGALSVPSYLYQEPKYVFGAHQTVQPFMQGFGNTDVTELGYFAPVELVYKSRLLPHWGIMTSQSLEARASGVYVDGLKVPVNADGQSIINLSSSEVYEERTEPLTRLFYDLVKEQTSDVRAGDYVVILGRMFTGGSNFFQTAAGRLPSDYLNVAVLNSYLTGRWIKEVEALTLTIGVASFIGAILGFFLISIYFGVAILATSALIMGVGLFSFGFYDVVLPWLQGLSALFASSTSVFIYRSRQRDAYVTKLRDSLSGMVSPDNLEALLRKPHSIDLEVQEHTVTTMFIDVVEFSEFANEVAPAEVFESLRMLFGSIGEIVHQHGGIIDKTLGDGVLCYFGYSFDGSRNVSNHADDAVRCATMIQRHQARNILESQDSTKVRLSHPLRIGINTGAVYIGDLGSSGKVEITLIGQSVNLAQRLESACEPFKIMLGPATRDLLTLPENEDRALNKRMVNIKHHKNVVTAFEWDPFIDDGSLTRKATEIFRKSRGVERKDLRWPVQPEGYVFASCEHGQGRVVDFSRNGLSLELPMFLAKGVKFNLQLDDQDHILKKKMYDLGLLAILVEVRWGRKSSGGFVHGLATQNLNPEQRQLLAFEIRQVIREHGVKRLEQKARAS